MENTMTLKTGGEVKTGYMGGYAWTGCNYNGYMSYGDVNKVVKKAFLAKYKGTQGFVKLSCTGSSFSGGQECNGTLTLKLADTIYDYATFKSNADRMGYWAPDQSWYYIDGKSVWGEKLDCDERLMAQYYYYVKELARWGMRMTNISTFDKCIFKPNAIEMVRELNAMYDSFNDEDINSQVDYFSVSFYKDVTLRVEV